MENAVDALKIAFAVFAFISVLAISLIYITQAKSTGDYVLYYNDKTNFYNNLSSKDKNRNVSITDVISTLYRYKDEGLNVIVKLGDGTYKFDTDLTEDDIKDLKSEGIWDKNTAPSTTADIETVVGNFISKKLNGLGENAQFLEDFVEVPYSGRYLIGEDGTEVILSAGDKKTYITYTLK